MGKRMDRRMDELKDKELKKQKKGKAKKFFIALLILLVCALMFIAGLVGYGYFTLHKISKDKVPPKTVALSKPVNLLILGVDAGDYNNYTKNNPNRSDTMMLVRYNPQTDKAYILSLPRDTKVKLKGHTEKLNAAHLSGVPYTISTIEKLLNIDINYYAEINYQGFRECIDAIGGVDITIPRDMNYDAWKINIHFKKGEKVHMDGKKAEEYVRWRKNNDGGGYAMGDIGRISTQQEFIVQIIKKLKTPYGMLHVFSLINVASKYIETNIPADTMLSYATKARNIKPEMMQKEILPGEAKYIGKVSYYIWNGDLNDKFLQKFRGIETPDTAINNNNAKDTSSKVNVDKSNDLADSSVPEANTNTKTNTPIKRNNIEVIILNSTRKAGLAALYKIKLKNLGYKVTQTGNYVYKKYSETLINDYSNKGDGNILYNDLNLGKVKQKQNSKPLADIVVILGADSIK